MDDREVIEAFVEGGGDVFGPALNVEAGVLKVDGWWSMAYRVTDRAFIVRDEEPPAHPAAPADVAAALSARGLSVVGADLPAIGLLAYTNLDLGYAPWVLWSTDLATGEADLNAKATEETFLQSGPSAGFSPDPADFEYARGARRVAGDASRVVLTVGLDDEAVAALRDGLADCRFESRALGEIEPADCGSLLPTLVLVDATGPAGAAFVDRLGGGGLVRAQVVAVTPGGGMQAGASATVDAADAPEAWARLLRDLLE